jgi:hypothetical protein
LSSIRIISIADMLHVPIIKRITFFVFKLNL